MTLTARAIAILALAALLCAVSLFSGCAGHIAAKFPVNTHRVTVTSPDGAVQVYTNTSHPWPEPDGCGFFDATDEIVHAVGNCEVEEIVK